MSRLQELMNNRKNDADKLRDSIKSLEHKFEKEEDTRFWQPTLDETDRSTALIRFLPPPPGEELPFVTLYNYAFREGDNWYIENSLTTLKQKDPCQEMINKLWAENTPASIALARKRGRKVGYYTNILVISDPVKPENNGKVFLFKFGAKIMDKIKAIQFPEFGEEPSNPFDVIDGCNFKIKISVNIVDGKKMRNWDQCMFAQPSSLLNTFSEDELEKILNSEYSLQTFIAPSQFKTYEELQIRLNKVLKIDDEPLFMKEGLKPEIDAEDQKFIAEMGMTKPKEAVKPVKKEAPPPKAASTDVDDDLSFFDNLISE